MSYDYNFLTRGYDCREGVAFSRAAREHSCRHWPQEESSSTELSVAPGDVCCISSSGIDQLGVTGRSAQPQTDDGPDLCHLTVREVHLFRVQRVENVGSLGVRVANLQV